MEVTPKPPTAKGPAEWFTGDVFMTHLSITEAVTGDARPEADWGEHVTDDEYRAR